MTAPDSSLREWRAVYERRRPILVAFVERLDLLFDELLDDYEWSYTWTEEPRAFLQRVYRARRAGVVFDDPIKELNGFAGLGIVVADATRATLAAETVERELEVNQDVSILPRQGADRPAFPRYSVSIPPAWAELSEWKPYEGLSVNVDVQTLLQHALERAESDLPYHWRRSYPESVQEKIAEYYSFVAAADECFDGIWTAIDELRARYEESVLRGELDLPVDGDSLVAYLRSSDTVAELVRIGIAAGLEPADEYEVDHLTVEQGLLWVLTRHEIVTLRELDDFLQNGIPRANEVLGDIVSLSAEAGLELSAVPDMIVEWLILVLRRADPETIQLIRYYQELDDVLNILIGNPIPPRGDH
jgi:hypothetical protein